MLNIWKSLHINKLFFYLLGGVIFLFVLGQFYDFFFQLARLALGVVVLAALVEVAVLFSGNNKVKARRKMSDRFSNGDINTVTLQISHTFPYVASLEIIDEVPVQFQIRDFNIPVRLKANQEMTRHYQLRPVERGEYHYGALNVFISSPLQLLKRRFRFDEGAMIKVYPSFLEMRKFEMLAISNRLSEVGIKKIRRIGHHMEFDQIRDYIKGDDYRTINWKATARKGHLMVNQYQEEKSQQVYSLIDMGRTMKMPFEGMTLLDYAINSSLVLSNIAMLKHDKAGLLTFNEKVQALLPAQRNGKHLQNILEILYNQHTGFGEHNLQAVYTNMRRHIHHRSLIMLYTNFESLSSARRQLPVLQKIAQDHLLVVVFFENTELRKLLRKETEDMEGIYVKTIAEKFTYDKKLIVKELERYGIHSVLTEPGNLTVDSLNKYLELKSMGYI
jgi:uncharacterized protein (DUF58 family)